MIERDRSSRTLLLGGLFLLTLLVSGSSLLWWSCGNSQEFNFMEGVTKSSALKSDAKAKLERAKILLDQKNYSDAHALLKEMEAGGADSSEVRIYDAGAILGIADLDILTILNNIITSLNSGSNSTTLNGVLNSITDTLLGTGAARTARIQALTDAITLLTSSPDPNDSKVSSTKCLLGAILAVPTITDGTTAMTNMQTALSQISGSASSNGTVCPNISAFNTAVTAVSTAATNLTKILDIAKNCTFLDLNQAVSQMSGITKSMKTMVTAVDKGCDSLPTCPSSLPNCQSLFPTCVQQVLKIGTSGAKSGDGIVSACEVVLHCIDPTQCFKSF